MRKGCTRPSATDDDEGTSRWNMEITDEASISRHAVRLWPIPCRPPCARHKAADPQDSCCDHSVSPRERAGSGLSASSEFAGNFPCDVKMKMPCKGTPKSSRSAACMGGWMASHPVIPYQGSREAVLNILDSQGIAMQRVAMVGHNSGTGTVNGPSLARGCCPCECMCCTGR